MVLDERLGDDVLRQMLGWLSPVDLGHLEMTSAEIKFTFRDDLIFYFLTVCVRVLEVVIILVETTKF